MDPWYFWTVLIWLLISLPVFVLLFKIKAPFGRHTAKGWGLPVSNRLAWFVMELPALIVMPAFAFAGSPGMIGTFFVILWIAHYFNRSCIFPFRIHTTGKTMPLGILLMALCFNLTNGFLCGYYFGNYANYANYTADLLMRPAFIIGLLLFGGGALLNITSDNILIRLRKKNDTGYVIPTGGLFKHISCPNLLGEITEWVGFALMTMAFPCFAFAVWTIANLLPRALAHHKWYHAKFADYPKRRRALIPFLL